MWVSVHGTSKPHYCEREREVSSVAGRERGGGHNFSIRPGPSSEKGSLLPVIRRVIFPLGVPGLFFQSCYNVPFDGLAPLRMCWSILAAALWSRAAIDIHQGGTNRSPLWFPSRWPSFSRVITVFFRREKGVRKSRLPRMISAAKEWSDGGDRRVKLTRYRLAWRAIVGCCLWLESYSRDGELPVSVLIFWNMGSCTIYST